MKLLSADFVRKFEKEKRLRPGDYDYKNDIYPALKERPGFYQVTDFIDRIKLRPVQLYCSLSRQRHSFIILI